ncbi:MAG: alpha/beta hydrolase [Bacteroidetes bacterium]|nr:alpha/beta hydrolase [Bacteroidota bacterium]
MSIKKTLIISFGILAASNMLAQTVVPLYGKEIPNSIASPNEEKWVGRPDGDQWVTGVSIPTLTVFTVESKQVKAPAVIICPGGGYGGLSMSKEGFKVAKELNEHGISAFVLKYRMPSDKTMKDRSIGPLQDAQQAIFLVKENAGKWGIDTTKIGIMGFSAGGHLAALASTHFQQPKIDSKKVSVRPDFSILVYPVISMEDNLTHAGSKSNLIGKDAKEETVKWFSSEKNITPNTPSAFLVHAQDDGAVNVRNSLCYYEALTDNKVPSELLIYPNGGHGFGMCNKTTKDLWLDHAIQWLEDYIFKK